MTTWSGSEHYTRGLYVREGLDTDGLNLTGAMTLTPRVVSAAGAITILATDSIVLINQGTPATATITLPASPKTQRVTIKDAGGNATLFPLTIVAASGNIDGNASVVLAKNFGAVELFYTGSTWSVLAPFKVTVAPKVRIVTAAGDVTHSVNDDIILVKKTVGAATAVNLMASPPTGQMITVKDAAGDATSNPITITPAAGTVDGAATYGLILGYAGVTLVYSGSEWLVVTGWAGA